MNAVSHPVAAGSIPAVYGAVSAVQAALAKAGISKSRRNQQQGFAFRGIDDVYEAVAPLLPAHGLTVFPRMIHRECEVRATKSGGTMFYVTVEAEFDFVATADGSRHTARTFGEASDSGDKATNKAMSAAMKYAVLMTFTVPTEGDNDADAHTPEPVAANDAPAIDPADYALRWDRMLAMADTLQALEKLKAHTAADRAAVKAADPAMSARINAAYKTRRAAIMAGSITQAG